MTNTLRQRISNIRMGAASAAPMLLVVLGLWVATTHLGQAQNFIVLYNFTGLSDGGNPYAGLIQDAAGNLYGTTLNGGDLTCNGGNGCGVVFAVDTSGTETVLYSFHGYGGDGTFPYAGVVRDAQGNLYGTTSQGGSNGTGTVFKVDTSGAEKVLHSFGPAGGTSDGCYPMGGLLRDDAGNLYGTTEECGASGEGAVYQLNKEGLTLLHSFAGGATDGAYPYLTGLVMDAKGNLYGVTEKGGASNQGVLYKMSPGGTLTLLHSFTGGKTDGCGPQGTPFLDAEGTLFGTTVKCGDGNDGIAWKLTRKGIETVVHDFRWCGGTSPEAGVVLDWRHFMYGDTLEGTVYEVTPWNRCKVLQPLGGAAYGGLLHVKSERGGSLYGTAEQGGSDGFGMVWEVTYLP